MNSLVRRALVSLSAGSLVVLACSTPPAVAVNANHGDRVVSANPADNTPHAMNGSVNAITQVGNKIIAAGTFTSVSPAGTFASTGDDLVRNRIFAFDATTGAIDLAFNPNLGGAVTSLSTDGTSIFVGGMFGSVGGNTTIKRLVKLTAAGAVVPGFKAVPNAGVNEVVVSGSRLFVGGAFQSIKSGTVTTARGALAALDPGTGAVLASVNVPFTGVYDPANNGGGATNVKRFDVTPDGSRLVAVGNFAAVAGQTRSQVAVLDTSGAATTVAPWFTDRYDRAHNPCAAVFDTFTRDVDFSPDGTFFVISSTGAFAGGSGSGTMCDTTARWETGSTGNDPTWADYTGGDTTYGVAITGSVVYVGGHMRWQNNPYQGDQAGPGAVPREGIAALDPVNGLPLSWNPGRTRGVGAQALFATSQGLWVGSDTTKIGRETHGRISLLPLAGGTQVPAVAAAQLPNNLFAAQRSTGSGGALYRVNAAGQALQAGDGGSDWTNDNGFVNGGSGADWGVTVPRDTTVPAGTPPDLFATERYGEQDWNFPVTPGRTVTVRLYFANQYDGTSQPGQRVFDVLVDGTTRLDNFDIAASAGDNTGTMRSFTFAADGDGVDIDLRNVVENALINGIEIVDGTGAGGGALTPGVLQRRAVDGSGAPTGAPATANTSFDWATVRGAFLVNSTVYYGLADGGLYRRSFNPSTGATGAQQAVNLYDDPETGERIPFPIANMTGAFYDAGTHRLYYTTFGDGRLFYRYFTPESSVVGAQTFQADSAGVDFSTVAGMTLAGGRILYGSSSDGSLRTVPFAGGRVTGSPTVVSADGTWRYRALLVPNG
jgi:hypothetical protein